MNGLSWDRYRIDPITNLIIYPMTKYLISSVYVCMPVRSILCSLLPEGKVWQVRCLNEMGKLLPSIQLI